MLIMQDTKYMTLNFELGGGLESGDRGGYVIGIEELEEQVFEWVRAVCARLGGKVVVVVLESLTS